MKDGISYKDSGVDKSEGYRAVELMKKKVAASHNSSVLQGLGSFGAFYELGEFAQPVLVSGTDGVGTKLKIAFKTNTYNTIGQDCVAMCVNDILCHGAKPLFFLDYLACGKLDADVAATIVGGIADACVETGTALIGGETAEMPGFYKEGEYDIAGFAVGVVEKANIINGSNVGAGDVIIALPSSGIHSNGFSLVRKLITDLSQDFNGRPMGEVLLTPTKLYVDVVLEIIKKYSVHGMAHITGGGIIENLPRAFPESFDAEVDKSKIDILPIFKHIQSLGVNEEEMWSTFNMGIGFVLIVPASEASIIIGELKNKGENAQEIGQIIPGSGAVQFI